MAENPYDRLPYTDHAYAESHPNRLAVVAHLSGWRPPQLPGARILEIGCARGGNLLPMAAGLPEASLIGLEPSARQVEEARRMADAAGLKNVEIVRAGFESADIESASFDYVICHGLYSWIPLSSRRHLLSAVARWLAPGGVAYVSFNTLPGWYQKLAARDWMRASANEGDPLAAREALDWLIAQVAPSDGPAPSSYRHRLEQVRARLQETEAAYLVHEYLSEEHHPAYVDAFLKEAEGAGLAYLGDAIPANTALELLPEGVAARVAGRGVAELQRIVDFVQNTSFRRALLVRSDQAAARGFRFPERLDPGALAGLRVASRLRPEGSDFFRGADEIVQVVDPATRNALEELARAAPRSRAFRDLAPSEGLAGELFDLWLATGELDLYVHEPPMRTSVDDGAGPRALPLARMHAARRAVTNAWHQEVRLPDALVRFVLARLDGSRSLPMCTHEAVASGLLRGASSQEASALVRAAVELLAASALLEA